MKLLFEKIMITAIIRNLPVLKTPINSIALPDNNLWQNRFEIRSQTSDRIYIVAQNKKKRHWSCSCPGWRRYRHCKHLQIIGLPCFEKPHEVEYHSN